jgi:hypothetical protein
MSKERKIGKRPILNWRLSPKLKEQLEAAARDEKVSLDAVLSRIARAWLATRLGAGDASNLTRGRAASMERAGFCEEADAYVPGADDARARASQRRASGGPNRRQRKAAGDAEQQRQLREQLLRAAGTVSIGGPSATNAEVRRVMGEYLEAKYRASQRRAPRRSR